MDAWLDVISLKCTKLRNGRSEIFHAALANNLYSFDI